MPIQSFLIDRSGQETIIISAIVLAAKDVMRTYVARSLLLTTCVWLVEQRGTGQGERSFGGVWLRVKWDGRYPTRKYSWHILQKRGQVDNSIPLK